jgi:hypothetical protein
MAGQLNASPISNGSAEAPNVSSNLRAHLFMLMAADFYGVVEHFVKSSNVAIANTTATVILAAFLARHLKGATFGLNGQHFCTANPISKTFKPPRFFLRWNI